METEQQDSSATGQQGNKPEPFKPVSEIRNGDGSMVAYDLLEESAREIGIPATAAKYNVNVKALRSRARDHKWRGIPDGRTLQKRNATTGRELTAGEGDFSSRIAPFREKVFKKVDESIAKFRPKAPKSFKELDSASKIAERMMGIGDEATKIGVLVHLNEAIDQHGEDMKPIEATLIDDAEPTLQNCNESLIPSSPATLIQGNSDAVAQPNSPKESDALKESVSTSLTLNPGDSSKRQYVLPGIIESGKQ